MILPILIWVFVIFRYAVNIPWFDDFDPFPDFLRQWITNESAATRLKLVFQPNNEHRMVFGKLAALVYYLITGNLNFVFLQITGACFTLGTCYILWTSFRNSKINWWYFLPVPFLLFQFQYHLVFLWSICSLQHQPVIFFVTLTMFFLSKDRFTWAIVAGFCATFAMSNGIFVWAGGVAILFSRANFRQLGLWVFVGIIAVSLYFYGMSAQGNESSLDFLLKNPHLSILGFLAFLGGLFDLFPWLRIEYRSVLPVVFSTFVMLFVITWLLSVFVPVTKQYWKFPKRIPVFVARFIPVGSNSRGLSAMLLGILVFLLSNALIIGLLRPRFGFFVMVVSNYKIYPAIFLSVAYLAFLSSSSGRSIQKTGYLGVLSISIIIWILSAFNYLPTISERHKYLLVNAYNQEHNAFGLGHVPFSKGAAYVDTLMTTMVKKGIYSYPPETASLVPEIEKVKNALPSKGSTRADIKDGVIQLKDSLGSYSYDYEDGKFPFIINGERLYLFKMDQNQYIGRNLLRQFDRGSGLEIPLSMLVPGSYKLGVVKIEGSSVTSNIVTTFNVP
jgi:hypothetical protein